MSDIRRANGPTRVVTLTIPDVETAAALFGPGDAADTCRLVCVNMIPAPPEARLAAVTAGGLTLGLDAPTAFGYTTLMVPWAQIAYVTRGGEEE